MELMLDPQAPPLTAHGDRRPPRDPRQHRPSVLRRLLEAGLSATTLCLILPEWQALIRQVDGERCSPGSAITPVR